MSAGMLFIYLSCCVCYPGAAEHEAALAVKPIVKAAAPAPQIVVIREPTPERQPTPTTLQTDHEVSMLSGVC